MHIRTRKANLQTLYVSGILTSNVCLDIMHYMKKEISVLDLFKKLFHNFNARAMKDATLAFKKHLDEGGKMFLAMGGAMSSAQMGVTLASMIKENKIHAISCTGANLEESVFRLVAHNSYKDYPDYRYFTKEDDEAILNRGERRVTDTSIPEEEAFRVVDQQMRP